MKKIGKRVWEPQLAATLEHRSGLLGLAGTRIDKLSIHRKSHVTKPAHATFAGRWAHHVGSHPVRYALVGFVALCAIAALMLVTSASVSPFAAS